MAYRPFDNPRQGSKPCRGVYKKKEKKTMNKKLHRFWFTVAGIIVIGVMGNMACEYFAAIDFEMTKQTLEYAIASLIVVMLVVVIVLMAGGEI